METFLLVFSDLYAFDCAVGRLSHISNASAYTRVDRLLKYKAAAAKHIYIYLYTSKKSSSNIRESCKKKQHHRQYALRGTRNVLLT